MRTWIYTKVYHALKKELGLTDSEYSVLDLVWRVQVYPDNLHSGWCDWNKDEIAEALNLSRRAVMKAITAGEKRGFIEKSNRGRLLKVTELWWAAWRAHDTGIIQSAKSALKRENRVQKVHSDGAKSALNTIYSINNSIKRGTHTHKTSSQERVPKAVYKAAKVAFNSAVEKLTESDTGVENSFFAGRHGRNLKALLLKIRAGAAKFHKLETVEELQDEQWVESFELFLQSVIDMRDGWYRENAFTPSGLLTFYDEIVLKLKIKRDGKKQASNKQTTGEKLGSLFGNGQRY